MRAGIIKIDYKIESIGHDKALIHRRILTPFFYIKLKPIVAKFERSKRFIDFIHMGFTSMAIKVPEGKFRDVGEWSLKGRYTEALELINKSYCRLEKI